MTKQRTRGAAIRSRVPRIIASIALGAALVVGSTGCSMMARQATLMPYSAGDGVNVEDSGPLQVRNALIVATEDGSAGNFIAAVVNPTSEGHVLLLDFGDGAGNASVSVPANSVVSLGGDGQDGAEPILIEGLDVLPGAATPVYFQSGDSDTVRAIVPVLDGELPYLAPLVP